MNCFIAVHNAIQIWKVSVQVNALSIFTSRGPALVSILATEKHHIYVLYLSQLITALLATIKLNQIYAQHLGV